MSATGVEAVPAARDWRDVLRDATDLALVGITVVLASVPVLTAGAAVGTASAAVHDWAETGTWPPARRILARFGRALLPGAAVTVLAVLVTGLLVADLLALAAGRVPGGTPALLVTVAVAVALVGYAGLVVVEVGRAGGAGWRAAARSAAGTCLARPGLWAALSGVTLLTGFLAVLVHPVAVTLLAGYAIAALHAVTRRAAA
ncbi:hypothetical protein AWW66_29395 [Micromonospora rosaria]|uniref:DUF624 domain-containing protein n=2 Tax=Micromonospora TaxID=1873 RepID=A0A136PJC0_9ACTN|nr:hypothetical protein [Micromonospora rosaria]KXK58510.1 hypothetical protein AWW66_29395 [Micromonospora rosaria]